MNTDAIPPLVLPPAINFDDEIVVDRYDRREDLSVQVRLVMGGPWHAKVIGGSHTRCGKVLGGYATRPEAYGPKRSDMCQDGCFSSFELDVLLPLDPLTPDPPRKR